MAERGISCRVGIQPLHQEPFYATHYEGVHFPFSEEAAGFTMFPPVLLGMTEQQQSQMVTASKDALAGNYHWRRRASVPAPRWIVVDLHAALH
jgi:dTDP-4-amino-4,6-dideoxygalactose transaminase